MREDILVKPRWVRDFNRFLPLKSQFVFSGNVRDKYPRPVDGGLPQLLPLVPYLGAELFEQHTKRIIAFDPARGFWLPPVLGADARSDREYFAALGISLDKEGKFAVSLERFFELLVAVTASAPEPTAIIADFAARLVVRADHLGDVEHRGFTRAVVAAHAVEPRPNAETGQPGFNPVLWIVEKEGDLPDWFIVGNPRLRHIPVPKPDHVARRAVISGLMKTLPAADAPQEAIVKAEEAFVEGTEGLLVVDLANIVQLSGAEKLKATDTVEAIRRYKLGVTEDPWRRIGREKLVNAEKFVLSRVKGQPLAVQHLLDIVKRAATGIGGQRGGRPRGVAFLAGPTGVGKTELAKTITTLLFGDESAYVRFDMSEFSAQHADQRLIGAPPGYVGYDTGGELTNAIREKPFSVVLFDEIEKAHPRILDKFLQVLDDGVLTSGRGERVYFSESLIVFTSNLGITRELPDGARALNVTPDDAPEVMRAKVREEIERHFKFEISRPELLNRIGENIIVFDFIRPDSAREIFDAMTARILQDIRAEQGIEIALEEPAHAKLAGLCLGDLTNGGRGVRNQLEAHFVNPLARGLFTFNPQPGDRFRIGDMTVRIGTSELQISRD